MEKEDNKDNRNWLLKCWDKLVLGKTERPNNQFSYGDSMNRITLTRPKDIQLQIELVDLAYAVKEYPLDTQLKLRFLEKVLPYTKYIDQQATLENLGFDEIPTLITIWCDVMILPLSERGMIKMEQTIRSLIPAEMLNSKEN